MAPVDLILYTGVPNYELVTRGYGVEDMREKLIGVLSQSKTGLTGVEIAEKLKVNRVTMSKYLKVFAAEGLIKQKKIGSISLWFVEKGVDQLNFPSDYFQVKKKYLEYVMSGGTSEAENLIRTSIHSGASQSKLVNEVIIPAIDVIENSYDNGKIGKSEKNFLEGIILTSVSLVRLSEKESNLKKNVVILSTDDKNSILAQAASAAFHSEEWRVYHLGDMSSAIDVLFDMDLLRFLNKIWARREGVMIVVVFSSTEGTTKFFSQAVRASKAKLGKNLRLVLCSKFAKKTKMASDFASDDLESILQWSQTVFESSQTH